MKRRSFFGSLVAGLSLIAVPGFATTGAKRKVEPFVDWKAELLPLEGKRINRTLHLNPRMSPPSEILHGGQTFAIVSSDLKNRKSVYKQTESIAERSKHAWQMYCDKADGFGMATVSSEPTTGGMMFAGVDSVLPNVTQAVR